MKKIKILYVVSSLKNTGPINQLLGIVRSINQNEFEIRILTLSPNPEDHRQDEFENIGLKIDSLGLNKIESILLGRNKLEKYLNRYSPDLIHTTGVRPDALVNSTKFSSKQVITIRNFAREDYISKFGNLLGRVLVYSTERVLKNSKNNIFCSKSLMKLYRKSGDFSGMVIQNGVDNKNFFPAKSIEEKKDLRRKLNLPKDKIIFLSVGSLIERKNPLEIIYAFKAIPNINENAILLFLGEGSLTESCNVHKSENIIFMGSVRNVNEYMRASDVFISSSTSEGLPNTVLEASISGMDLILSNIPQHKEIFNDFSRKDFFYQLGNVDELSNKIKLKLNNIDLLPNFEISDYINSYFDMESMSLRYQDIYKEILGADNSENKKKK